MNDSIFSDIKIKNSRVQTNIHTFNEIIVDIPLYLTDTEIELTLSFGKDVNMQIPDDIERYISNLYFKKKYGICLEDLEKVMPELTV